MKKLLIISALLFIGLSQHVHAQTNNDLACKKGSSSVSLGYGFINVWKVFLKKIVDNPEYKIKATGPVTLIYEYGINRRFSGGIIASYSRINGKSEKIQFADQITFLTLQARANYHLFTSKKLDPYFGGGIGINNSKYKNLDTHTVNIDANKNVPSNLDFSGQVGLKYFPLPNLGCYVEAGYVSGAIVHIGITSSF
jgi:opacity protein-like surface antigen